MDGAGHKRVGEVLANALMRPLAERDAFVRAACAGDAEVEAEVRRLIAESLGVLRFLGGPSTVEGPGPAPVAPEEPGAVIGRYRLLEQIGEGGFGVVFLAEQREPVQRRVALKVIKLGMDTRQVVARFEAERQALALMDHPNIATVLDGGATETGRPYFVMELVRGDPITEYCDTNNLGVPQRLELFVQVCGAVQHAHQKGIIHRDLKPHNVLVTVGDGRAVPKVIDFGIAKATSGRLTEKTLFTEHRQLIGTPEYMSPEQAEMSGVDIDTRSDIYSLGVLLYELLTGTTPFDARELRQAGFGEIQRIIREVEPPRPSTRLLSLKGTALSVAARRRTEPARLRGLIRGDLDWIVMKCLEKDRTRRYETASSLAADVQRHLSGEPVTAAPPSGAYRLKKLVRRNRGAVAASVLVLLALAGGLAATLTQAREARRQAARADERARAAETAEAEQRRLAASESAARGEAQAQRAAAEAAALAEKQRADELEQVSDFQAEMLAQVSATEAGVRLTEDVVGRLEASLAAVPEAEGKERLEAFRVEWREINATDVARALIDGAILKPAVAAIDKEFEDQPLVAARLREVLSERYRSLGLDAAAMPLQESTLATHRRILGNDHPRTIDSIGRMGMLLTAQGRASEAEPYVEEALETCRRLWGEDHKLTLEALADRATLQKEQGRADQAEMTMREVLEKKRRVLGLDDASTVMALHNLGVMLQAQGKLEEAEELLVEALEEMRRSRGEEHLDTLGSINNLAILYLTQERAAEAEPYCREVLEKSRRVLGEEHPLTLSSLNTMGLLLHAQGRDVEAEPFFREALEKARRVLGEEQSGTLSAITNMAHMLRKLGKHAEAERYFREAFEKKRRVLGENHADTWLAFDLLAGALKKQGKLAECEALYREGLEASRRLRGDDSPATLGLIYRLGALLLAERKLVEAEALLLPGAASAGKLPPESGASADFARTIAELYEAWNEAEPGKGYGDKAVEWRAQAAAAGAEPVTQKP